MRPLVLHSHLSGTASSCLYETSSGNCTKAQSKLGTPLTGTVMVLMKMLFMIYTKMKGTIIMPKKRQQYCLSNFSLLNISSSGNGTILRPGARYQAIQHHQAFKLFFLLKMLTLHSSKENLVFKENILLAGCGRCMLWRRRRKCLEMDDAKVGSSNHPNRHLSPYSYLPHSNPHPHSDPQPNPHKGYSYITTMQFLAFKQLYTYFCSIKPPASNI